MLKKVVKKSLKRMECFWFSYFIGVMAGVLCAGVGWLFLLIVRYPASIIIGSDTGERWIAWFNQYGPTLLFVIMLGTTVVTFVLTVKKSWHEVK